MRGKDGRRQKRKPRVGITPAYAGKSLRGFAKVMALSDHPRICGEKKGKMEEKMKYTGSPPHMRGKGHEKEIRIHVTGITPAYAGKSLIAIRSKACRWDHPRICGEKRLIALVLRAVLGSPPHMRGKGRSVHRSNEPAGITPAYAGKRIAPLSFSFVNWDHPRICGEKRCIPVF